MIKDWPQFGNMLPYSAWFTCGTKEWKFVPLSEPCAVHADGFDCYHSACKCAEWKFVLRSPEEIAEIDRLQREVSEDAALRRADEIRAGRAA